MTDDQLSMPALNALIRQLAQAKQEPKILGVFSVSTFIAGVFAIAMALFAIAGWATRGSSQTEANTEAIRNLNTQLLDIKEGQTKLVVAINHLADTSGKPQSAPLVQ